MKLYEVMRWKEECRIFRGGMEKCEVDADERMRVGTKRRIEVHRDYRKVGWVS